MSDGVVDCGTGSPLQVSGQSVSDDKFFLFLETFNQDLNLIIQKKIFFLYFIN